MTDYEIKGCVFHNLGKPAPPPHWTKRLCSYVEWVVMERIAPPFIGLGVIVYLLKLAS